MVCQQPCISRPPLSEDETQTLRYGGVWAPLRRSFQHATLVEEAALVAVMDGADGESRVDVED